MLLELDDLRVWFPVRRGLLARTVGHIRAVDGVSFSLNTGESLGLVGESGCGKTTVARAILGLEPCAGGSIHFSGHDIGTLRPRELRPLRRQLQIVFQDPFASLNPRMTILDILTEGAIEHRLIRPAQRAGTAVQLLREVGMDVDALNRYPHEFSGGQRQRICLARAMSTRPALIVCDEPVSALDVSVQAQVLNLMNDLKARHRLSYLFITHNLSVIPHIADRVAVMYMGRIVEIGPAADVTSRPAHPYTRALISAVPRFGSHDRKRIVLPGDVPSPEHPPAGCRFHTRCPFAIAACAGTDPRLETPARDSDRLVACIRANELER